MPAAARRCSAERVAPMRRSAAATAAGGAVGASVRSSWRPMALATACSVASTEARACGCSRAPATPTRGITSGSRRARSTSGSRILRSWPNRCGASSTSTWRRANTLRRASSPSPHSTSASICRTPFMVNFGGGPSSSAARSMASVSRSTGQPIDANSPRQRLTSSSSTARFSPPEWSWRLRHEPETSGLHAACTRPRSPPSASSERRSPRSGRRRSASVAAAPTGPGPPRWRTPTRLLPGPPRPGRPRWRRANAPATARCPRPSTRPCRLSFQPRWPAAHDRAGRDLRLSKWRAGCSRKSAPPLL